MAPFCKPLARYLSKAANIRQKWRERKFNTLITGGNFTSP